jgi:hypothetical protein
MSAWNRVRPAVDPGAPVTDPTLPAEPPPQTEPAPKPRPGRSFDRAALARLAVIAGFLLLALGLWFLSRQRYYHSVTVAGWGCDANLDHAALVGGVLGESTAEFHPDIEVRGGRLSFTSTSASFAGTAASVLGTPSIHLGNSNKARGVFLSAPAPFELSVGGVRTADSEALKGGFVLMANASIERVYYHEHAGLDGVHHLFELDGARPGSEARDWSGTGENVLWFRSGYPLAIECRSSGPDLNVRLILANDSGHISGKLGRAVIYSSSPADEKALASLGNSGKMDLTLDCLPNDTVSIGEIRLRAVTLRLDSGSAAVSSHLRPTPQRFELPVLLYAKGHLTLRVRRIGSQLRFDLAGVANSVRYASGVGTFDPGDDRFVRRAELARVKQLGVELIPSAVESGRDTFLAVAGILVILTQLVKFLWDLFKK